MTSLTLMITRAGQARFTAAQLDAEINLGIAQIGLTDAPFVSAPTLEALPGEFKRLVSISGEQVGDNIVHLGIRDESADTYTARGFGLFLADGTLFATYAQADRLFQKSSRATLLAAIDIAFPTGDVSELRFGNTDFLNPPATTERKGVARFATSGEVAAGTSTGTAVTPADLRRVIGIGFISLWYGAAASIPAGWAICNGQEVARSDGSGSIATPDLRGRVAVGAVSNDAVGAGFGKAVHNLTTSRVANHRHLADATVQNATTGITVTSTTRDVDAGGSANGVLRTVTLNDPMHTHAASVSVADAGAHDHAVTVDVTQPSLALHYIMKV